MWDRAGPGGPRRTGSSRSPPRTPRADSGRAPPHAAGAGRPAGPAPGSLASGVAPRAHSPSAPPPRLPQGLPRTYCSLCNETPGEDAITGWPRPAGRRTASGLPAPSLRAPARAASARENGRRLMTTRSLAAPGSRLLRPAEARPPLPRRAPTYLTPLLRLCDAEALPFFLQRSRLAPHLTSVCHMLPGNCSL